MAGRRKVSGHVQKGGKSLMVQRKFSKLGIPRMYRSSGTRDKNVFTSINNMLTALAETGTPESVALLAKLNTGEVSFLEAVGEWKKKGLRGVEKYAEDNPPIDEVSCIKWLKSHYEKETTRVGYLLNYRTMMRHAEPGQRMNDLPVILKRYQRWCVENGKNHRAFDYALAVAQAWVKTALGDDSETYRQLRKIERFNKKPDARSKPYFSPRDVMNAVQKLPDNIGAMVWSMACYGTNPKEYCEDGWEVDGDGVRIFGEKTAHRKRRVPLLPKWPPAPVAVTNYKRLLVYLKKASNNAMTPNAMRNAYPRWLTAAGIPYNRVRMYQGHAESSMTDTYAFHDTAKQLKDDAALFQTWLESQLASEPASTDTIKVRVGRPRGWTKGKRGSFRRGVANIETLVTTKPMHMKRPAGRRNSGLAKAG